MKEKKVDFVIDLRGEGNREEEKRRLIESGKAYFNIELSTVEVKDKIVIDIAYPQDYKGQRMQLPENAIPLVKNGHPVPGKYLVDRNDAVLSTVALLNEGIENGDNAYVHCQRGEDRTGTVLWLLRQHQGKADVGAKEFRACGGTLYPPLQSLKTQVESKINKGSAKRASTTSGGS